MLEDKIKVEVKQEHIDNGKRCDPSRCAIALAVKDSVTVCGANVGLDELYLYESQTCVKTYHMDNEGQSLRINFDNGKEVSPTTFEISRIVLS